MDVRDRVLLVVGVGEGLGTATISQLATDGAVVIGVARRPEVLDRLETYGKKHGWKFHGRRADSKVQKEVDRVVASVISDFGHIDGVSVNAGHWVPGETLIHRMSDKEWTDGLVDNLEPFFRVSRAVLPHMVAHGSGSIVTVSAAPHIRTDGSASYAAAKGGLLELVRKLALDYRSEGVRFNGVLPGSMNGEVTSMEPPSGSAFVPLSNSVPTSPWEVARAIEYLLSDSSRWVSGTLLTVDGGYSTWGKEQANVPSK
jgi:NAD(P)-dependent dehydrogenase (short-subunit alcohol dehydrogenase family)